jgi:hypothetical protein
MKVRASCVALDRFVRLHKILHLPLPVSLCQ